MFKNIYVKKLWSLNPDEYKYISLDEAIEQYAYYVSRSVHPLDDKKSFQEWLATEI